MSDDELMEAAARASGLILLARMDGRYLVRDGRSDSAWEWNPLTDDGDALRLAVRLGLKVDAHELRTVVWVAGEWPCERLLSEELANGDPYAATRRAVVRAAASLGSEKAAAPHTAAHLR